MEKYLIALLKKLRAAVRNTTFWNAGAAATFGAQLIARCMLRENFGIHQQYRVECFGPDGQLKWVETIDNIVVNVGLDDILDKYYKGSTYTASHFVGLTDGTPTVAAADTMASHVGWAEVHTEYSEATRPALTLGTVSGQSVDNSASKATYSITGTATVGGAFVTTDSTKNGAGGTLVGVGAFTGGDKAVANLDTLNVTVTLTASSS